MSDLKYPDFPRDESVVDEFFGTKVADPYRALEDMKSDAARKFIEEQNRLSAEVIGRCQHRRAIEERLTKLRDYPRYSTTYRAGDKYFYRYNSGLQLHSVLYVKDTWASEPRVLIDPNQLSEDGSVSLAGSSVTKDGKLIAYSLSSCGLDWRTIRFKRTDDSSDLADKLENVKFSCITWAPDNSGIFYNSYPTGQPSADAAVKELDLNQKLMFHKLGDSQDKDRLCLEFPDNPKWIMAASVTDCERYVVLTVNEGCQPANRLYVVDLQADSGAGLLQYQAISDNFNAQYHYVTNNDKQFYFVTNHNAPRNRIVQYCLGKRKWTEVIPQHKADVLDWALCTNQDRLLINYRRDVKDLLFITDLATGTNWRQLDFGIGSVASASTERHHNELFFSYTSFITPYDEYRVEFNDKGEHSMVKIRTARPANFNADELEQQQIFYKSKDGTNVPMFIVRCKRRRSSGPAPCLLYGYGGFNISIMPYFSPNLLPLLTNFDGVLAVANIRGGDEYGEDWHLGGCKSNKQNCFDDFIGAAEHLVANGYTSKQLLAIEGGSNGGLLVAACCLQRPELYGAVLCSMGVLDMLRFHRFTIGHGWTTDYGCADKSEQEFRTLFRYSPLHAAASLTDAQCRQLPALLAMSASHDDRVVPLHTMKFIAQLQHRAKGLAANPLLARFDTKTGHGAGKPLSKQIEERTDMLCFLQATLNWKWYDN